MSGPIQHAGEPSSNPIRATLAQVEPLAQRTFTPTQMVIESSSSIYHWTAEGRRLYDFTSGVLVANLGHNPTSWMQRFSSFMGWDQRRQSTPVKAMSQSLNEFFPALPFTAYNAVTAVEVEAGRRLIDLLHHRPGGNRLERVLWAASGSEAIQKSLWAALARAPERDRIIATRHGFHGKKGLAGAVSGCETDQERDARVCFISFPMSECVDLCERGRPFDSAQYRRELAALWKEHGSRLGTLITEPYLGAAGSYHPPPAYLLLLQEFCREHDLVFILDEVQSNFGRTSELFAFESYDLEPDLVILGKSLGNGVPVAAAAGRADILGSLGFGEGSDTWSANPLSCAAVLATLDEFASGDILGRRRAASAVIESGLLRLKELPFVEHVRGEWGGMVWGLEMKDHGGRRAADWANGAVLTCYQGEGHEGIHLMGPLAEKVLRIAPPLVISPDEAGAALDLMCRLLHRQAAE
jgi:4-aminobutyrate aminotransferase-like enzyme